MGFTLGVIMEEKLIKINDKVVSIPPYLSTSWSAVAHIRSVGDRLVFTMKDGEAVSIPGFTDGLKKQVFDCHIHFLEGELRLPPKNMMMMPMPPVDILKINLQNPDFANMMQHNGDQRNMPPMPPDVLDKITKMLKVIGPNDPEMFPKAEPHCNCPYCQIARILHDMKPEEAVIEQAPAEEVVTDEELTFSQYLIESAGEKLFHVTDKLFPTEKFTVFLGEPVGCTCGKSGCEHLIAVLKS